MRCAHLPDGTTAFWGTTADKSPIAKRWSSGESPWRISLALEGTEEASIELEMSMDPWKYSLDLTAQQTFRKGLRSVVAVQARARCMGPPFCAAQYRACGLQAALACRSLGAGSCALDGDCSKPCVAHNGSRQSIALTTAQQPAACRLSKRGAC